jgi:hypothetical protein
VLELVGLCDVVSFRAEVLQEINYAKGSQALSVKFWVGRTGVLEVPGEHSASMDKKCSEVTHADPAGDR